MVNDNARTYIEIRTKIESKYCLPMKSKYVNHLLLRREFHVLSRILWTIVMRVICKNTLIDAFKIYTRNAKHEHRMHA